MEKLFLKKKQGKSSKTCLIKFHAQGVYYGNVTENGTAGMMVMTMTAIDYDDVEEGTNAKLRYSIEKNVIDENTGTPIFEIEEETGVIKTAVCCLDREKTPDYSIQVVAMDGGGLKGTGTASIRVKDINDMPPRFVPHYFECINGKQSLILTFTHVQLYQGRVGDGG